MVKCSVRTCKNNSNKKSREGHVKYHQFPREFGVCKKWIKACDRKITNIKHAKICSKHFDDNSYKLQDRLLNTPLKQRTLIPNAIPNLCLPEPQKISDNDIKSKKRERTEKIEEILAESQLQRRRLENDDDDIDRRAKRPRLSPTPTLPSSSSSSSSSTISFFSDSSDTSDSDSDLSSNLLDSLIDSESDTSSLMNNDEDENDESGSTNSPRLDSDEENEMEEEEENDGTDEFEDDDDISDTNNDNIDEIDEDNNRDEIYIKEEPCVLNENNDSNIENCLATNINDNSEINCDDHENDIKPDIDAIEFFRNVSNEESYFEVNSEVIKTENEIEDGSNNGSETEIVNEKVAVTGSREVNVSDNVDKNAG